MNILQKFLGHIKTVSVHRFWVFYFCCKAGIPIRGLFHDLSKFSPTEFFESVRYYQGTSSPIDACKKDKGYSRAWLHHKGRNPHHYEFWQDNFDNGGTPLKMPYKYAVEMVCDYLAAGKAYMGKNFTYEAEYEWWKIKKSKTLAMNEHTKEFIDDMLKMMASRNSCIFLKRSLSLQVYKEVEQKISLRNKKAAEK